MLIRRLPGLPALWAAILGFILLLPFRSMALPLSLHGRQTYSGMWGYDLSGYGCRPVIFIYCRETIAPGNLGFWVGPEISNRLKVYFGPHNVATQGVDYGALIDTNFYSGGAPPVGISLMQNLLNTAAAYCPYSAIVAAGYSQGAAVTHRAVEGLSQYTKNRIVAVVTFGDTQTTQDGGRIKGFPPAKTLIICNYGDVICSGTLWVFPIHFDYTRRVPEAVRWLVTKIVTAFLASGLQVPTPVPYPTYPLPTTGANPGVPGTMPVPGVPLNDTAPSVTSMLTSIQTTPVPTALPSFPNPIGELPISEAPTELVSEIMSLLPTTVANATTATVATSETAISAPGPQLTSPPT